MTMIIKNAHVFGEDKSFVKKDVFIEDGKIVTSTVDTEDILDGEGCFLIPGLVDIHFHGCVGADFCDANVDAISRIAEYEASVGVTSICPATLTLAEDDLHKIMKTACAYENKKGAKLVGINMEGPFISVEKKGAHVEKYIRKCDVELFHKLQEESGNLIKLVDVAPEIDGAMEFIEAVKDEVVVSIAHTMADYDTATEALKKGASHVTHLYNAMLSMNHRDPGVIGAAMDDDNCNPELICDGVHIHPSVVRATFAMFGAERVIMISDSMCATGLEDGEYALGSQHVSVRGSKATLVDGTIAGSATNLMACIRWAVNTAGISLEDAIASASMNPAKKIGIYEECGSITPGKAADLVLLDKELQVQAVFVNGIKQGSSEQ